MVFEHELKEGVLRINVLGSIFGFTMEDSDVVMARTIDVLLTEKKISKVVLAETREYEYNESQTEMIMEIANAITRILRDEKLLSIEKLGGKKCERFTPTWYSWLHDLVTFQLRGDPIGAYVNLIREIRHVNVKASKASGTTRECFEHFLMNVLLPMRDILDDTKMIQLAKPSLSGWHIGNRDLYRLILKPSTRPNFMFTRFMIEPPKEGETVARYKVDGMAVEIFKIRNKVRSFYQVIPPEFKLAENEYTILDGARRILEQRRPRELEMQDQEKVRDIFHSLGIELVRDVSSQYDAKLSEAKITELSNILTRYTVGLGILEILLKDSNIQDIYINSPLGSSPVYIYHAKYGDCETNLFPTAADGDRWATRFKLISGRPLDEANPVLDTELTVPGGRARVAIINPRLSPDGLGFALRRHREKPWTFPLFMDAKFFDPLFAGLMSFVADYGRTFLIAGTRSSGKSSLLGSMLTEILPHYRMITVEDTLELPVVSLRKLGFNIERMKSRSVITRVETELPAEEALRAALRLGDSCLFIGEVRSTEAKALYEAMRIGALANVVAGTIHGESAYGVFDRVVNDLGVPATSFKATDFVVVCNRLRSADGLSTFRRVTDLTEVRKHWKIDPQDEGGFVSLMEYSSKEDKLKPTDTLLNGESVVLNEIANRVKEWSGNWAAVWDNIQLRGKIRQTLVDYAKELNNKNILEADFTVRSNQMFHILSNQSTKELGSVDAKFIEEKWLDWLKKELKSV
ncbi:MAG: type II/IV secretion system ATPase subunit [Candidatus Aenigmarchaeota archaeon]|nr:type II/IV secretion system ATPase subunit [Candidatus Aenigmarchaeota archaeon]